MFCVSSWWESKIFLSMCSLTLYCVALSSSLLHPLSARAAHGWAAVGHWGRRSFSGISPGLQLCCRTACVFLGPLDVFIESEVVLDTWIAPLVSGGLQCFLKRIPSWGDNNLKPFKLVVWPFTLGDRAGDMVSGPQVLLLSLGGESHKPYLYLTQMWQENSECDCWLELSCRVPCSGSHRCFLLGDCNFNVKILYLGASFVPLRFWKYKRGRELYIVVYVNSTSDCLNPCAKCPLHAAGREGKSCCKCSSDNWPT